VPKYRDIQAVLLERITQGIWAPGARIPDESDLAAEFGCTRPTISRALRELVETGLIERRRRAGSRVARRAARDVVLRIPLVRAEVTARGGSYSYLLVSRELATAPGEVRAAFGVDSDKKALHVMALHFENSTPYQLEDRWINLAVVPQAGEEDFAKISPNEWLVNTIPYTRAEHILRAGAAGKSEAAHLAIEPATPVFIIERTTWLRDQGVTRVRMSHPADRFSIISRDTGLWQV